MSIDLARILKSSSISREKVLDALGDIEKSIMKTREEIATAPSLENNHAMPQAIDELDAVIESTEVATNTILEAAEVIEKLASWTDASTAQDLKIEVTKIYEACNFQDLAGQRLAKVIRAFKEIEQKIHEIVKEMGADNHQSSDKIDSLFVIEENSQSSLMVGPQRSDKAIKQQDIDQIFEK